MLKEQEAGAERSRRLRKRALRRRGLLESNDSSTSSERDQMFSDKGGEESSTTDLFSENDDHMQVDDLLDIAQQYATKGLRPAEPKAQELSRYVKRVAQEDFKPTNCFHRTRRHGDNPNALNPASHAAAEEFRTQNRYLSDYNEPHGGSTRRQPSQNLLDSHKAPQSLALQDREQRLEEAKSPTGSANVGKGVSKPTLGNQFTRDDFGPRLPRRDLPERLTDRQAVEPKPHPQHQQNRVDYDVDNDGNYELSRRTPSGLEMLAAKAKARSSNDAADRARDETSATHRNIDNDEEQHNFDSDGENNGSQSLPRRPLSGLEMLAARQGATDTNAENAESRPRPLSGFEMLAAR
jgi:hypothetical protein